ncbi:MAG: type IV secretion system protein [bacterium]|nr:type IV secretion system protein [bacterium]
MQRHTFLAPIFIALILMGAFGMVAPAASTAHAQATTAAAPAAAPVVDTKKDPPAPPPVKSTDSVYGELMAKIMSLFAWLLGAATLMLDYAVYYGVVVMGDFVNKLSAIGVTWRILRDIGNIMLIFGFLASGIAVILNVNTYGFGTKMLPMLLVAAVFLNFSLFISEAIIDVNNLFATQIYQQINGGEIVGPSKLNSSDAVVNEGISNRIMSVIGLQALYNVASSKDDKTLEAAQKALEGSSWYVGFMGIILFIVASFVMFSLAFVIIARFVALVFLIVVAPIGFAGLAIPKLKGLADKWWSQLIEQAITAPVLLLLLYIALAVITDANFLTGVGAGSGCDAALGDYCGGSDTGWTGFLDTAKGGTGRFAGILFSFLVAMGLLLAVVVFAKRMSAFGAGWATRTSGRIVGGTIGYGLVGGASLAGRTVFGGAGRLANTEYVRAKAAQKGYRSLGWRALAFTGRNLEGRTYDLRNARLAQRAGGLAQKGLGAKIFGETTGLETIAAGMGKGATVTAKSATEAVRQTWKKISPLHGFEGSWWRDQQKEYEKAAATVDRKKVVNDPTHPDFVKTLKRMSDDELTELRGIRQGIAAFVTALSPEKYRSLQKNDKLLKTEKANLKSTWEAQFTPAVAAATLGRMSTEEIAGLEGDILTRGAVVEALGQNEFEAIRRKGSLKAGERGTMHTFMMAASAAGTAFGATVDDYFLPAHDVGGNRKRYWNV